MSSTPVAPTLRHDDVMQGRLLHEQIQSLCKHSNASLRSSIFTGLFVCWVLYADQPLWKIILWYISVVAVTLGRLWLQGPYRLTLDKLDERYSRVLIGAAAIGGFSWVAPAIWMIPAAPAAQVVLGIFMVGLAAVSFISLTPVRHAYTAFCGAMMLPIAVAYFRLGAEYSYTAIGAIAFAVFMSLSAYRQTGAIAEMLRVQLENEALARRLQQEKDVVEQANRELEREVKQRESTEAELRTAKTEAEQANRAKSQFLANMSHELRTPLNGVLGMSDLLIRSLSAAPSNSKPLKYATTIRTAGSRLLELINDILDMARIEAGALRFENAAFDPRRVIAEVSDLLGESARAKGLTLQIDVAPQVPEEVRGDANRVRQILTNLVANAIKFTEAGTITIELARAISDMPTNTTGSGRMHLLWSVSDTGIGIPKDAIDRLFQPFSQVDSSNTRRYGGTGLGLAICYQLVNALGGRIGVDSDEERGSRFWFEMPFERVKASKPKSAAPHVIARDILKGRVLVAEDNATNAQLVAEMLDMAGCEFEMVRNGLEAVAKLKEGRFDLVLMDWHMPELDGVEATKMWRVYESMQPSARIPIIALTASVLPGDREACLAAGMDDFIPKPVSYEDLVTKLGMWLPKKEPSVANSTVDA